MRAIPVALIGGFSAIVLVTGLLLAGSATISARDASGDGLAFELETPDLPSADPLPDTIPDPPSGLTQPSGNGEMQSLPSVRAIAPAEFALPEELARQPLERAAPREALAPEAAPEQNSEPTVLARPRAEAAGLIRFPGGLLQLDGLLPEPVERVCGDGASTWPCGMVARTAFRNYLRSRSLACDVPSAAWSGTVTARCTLGTADPAVWLAENGWAQAAPGSGLEERTDSARSARLGLFGDDPRRREPIVTLPSDPISPESADAFSPPPQ